MFPASPGGRQRRTVRLRYELSCHPAPQTEHLGYRMIALEVDDMQKTADYLRTKGVDIVWGPRVRETYSRAEICDPNGYHVELRSGSGSDEPMCRRADTRSLNDVTGGIR